jgi:hypothetical protein
MELGIERFLALFVPSIGKARDILGSIMTGILIY